VNDASARPIARTHPSRARTHHVSKAAAGLLMAKELEYLTRA
jgi:3-phosphoglycerate kinase